MITISLCMIVKNEEKTLPRCLASARGLAEEVIVVDTGSADGTVAAAEALGAKVFHFPWRDDFAAARNYAFDQATMDYCLWLDADDVIEPEDRKKFLELKATLPPDTDVVMLPYHAGRDEAGRPTLTYERERLIRRAAGLRWRGAVHEAIAPAGTIHHGDAAVTHRKEGPGDSGRNLRILEGLRARRPLEPREQYYYGRELAFLGREEEAVQALRAFLAGGRGWKPDCIQASMDLADCLGRLGREDERLPALTGALAYGPPTPELCCALGSVFMDRQQWETAAFWYHLALTQPAGSGFHYPDCRGYIPLLQLCVCSWNLGAREASEAFNDAALALKPECPVCRQNREFFNRWHQAHAES